mgnify:CR=1 FL=1
MSTINILNSIDVPRRFTLCYQTVLSNQQPLKHILIILSFFLIGAVLAYFTNSKCSELTLRVFLVA